MALFLTTFPTPLPLPSPILSACANFRSRWHLAPDIRSSSTPVSNASQCLLLLFFMPDHAYHNLFLLGNRDDFDPNQVSSRIGIMVEIIFSLHNPKWCYHQK